MGELPSRLNPIFTHGSHGRGRKVTSLGVIFDFTGNDVNTTVQKVEDMVKEHWVRAVSQYSMVPRYRANLFTQFAEAIEEEPDFFLLAGYVD